MSTEIMGLLQRLKAKNKHLRAKSKKVYNSYMLSTPAHIRSALQKCCMASTERLSKPLDFDPSFKNYFSANPRDQATICHTMIWLTKAYALPAGMYAYQIRSTRHLKEGAEMGCPSQTVHLLNCIFGVKGTTPNWSVP
eukprot:1150202-Pelagomonas_calceolata.AAC.2